MVLAVGVAVLEDVRVAHLALEGLGVLGRVRVRVRVRVSEP